MKIIYSPGFTSTSYLELEKRKGSLLGTKVCGSMELLSELELRAGIAVLDISESERLASFCEVMKIVGKDSVFWNSFQIAWQIYAHRIRDRRRLLCCLLSF